MRQFFVILGAVALMPGCAQIERVLPPKDRVSEAPEGTKRPEARPDAVLVPANAQTVEDFDTTTAQERAEAVTAAQKAPAARDLGRTIASLGSVSEPGIWLKTPLVRQPGPGRVDYAATGASVAVDLIPLDAEPGAGSQLSLAAMRLIKAPLTGLPELRVYLLPD